MLGTTHGPVWKGSRNVLGNDKIGVDVENLGRGHENGKKIWGCKNLLGKGYVIVLACAE